MPLRKPCGEGWIRGQGDCWLVQAEAEGEAEDGSMKRLQGVHTGNFSALPPGLSLEPPTCHTWTSGEDCHKADILQVREGSTRIGGPRLCLHPSDRCAHRGSPQCLLCELVTMEFCEAAVPFIT